MDNFQNRLHRIVDELAAGKYTVFAKKCGIPHSTFQNYINGRMPHSEHLLRIHDVFRVDINWLLSGEGEPYLADRQGAEKEHDSEDSVSKGVDSELLRRIISAIEKALDERDLVMPPDKKAEAISLLYELFSGTNKEVTDKTVGKYLRLVA